MSSLQELRKIGGFESLESRESRNGAADDDRTPARSRAHPALLIDILEISLIAKKDKARALQCAKNALADPINLYAEPLLRARSDLDAEIAAASRALDRCANLITAAQFIMARDRRLQIVRARIKPFPARLTTSPDSSLIEYDGAGRKRSTPPADDAIPASAKILIDDIAQQYLRVLYISQKISVAIASASALGGQMVSPENAHDVMLSAPCEIAATILEYMRAAQTPPRADDLDAHLQCMISKSRALHCAEQYYDLLLLQAKKIRAALDSACTQCAVLMSNRATIA